MAFIQLQIGFRSQARQMVLTKKELAQVHDAHSKRRIDTNRVIMSTQKGLFEELQVQLLDPSCNVDQLDENGATAVHWAVVSGFSRILRLLLDRGASIDIRDKNGLTCLHWAARFFDYTGYPWGYDESKVFPLETVQILLNHRNIDIEVKDPCGRTALHLTMYGGSLTMAKVLLDAGADKEAICNYEWTPLFCAVQMTTAGTDHVKPYMLSDKQSSTNVELVRLLLDKGASIDRIDVQGNTPMEFVEKMTIQTSHERLKKSIMSLLVKAEMYRSCIPNTTHL
jgi:hypothetical protein